MTSAWTGVGFSTGGGALSGRGTGSGAGSDSCTVPIIAMNLLAKLCTVNGLIM